MIYRGSLLALLLMTIWLPVGGQDSRGSISGRALDPSGSAIAGVQVQATNTGTGASVEAVTNDSGNYTLPFLLPGACNINAELTGFQRLERKGIEVRVNDSVTVDLSLSLGDITQSVEVSGATPLLEIEAVNLGQVYDTARITDLPRFLRTHV